MPVPTRTGFFLVHFLNRKYFIEKKFLAAAFIAFASLSAEAADIANTENIADADVAIDNFKTLLTANKAVGLVARLKA